jgi:gliding motility-associated-like protein
MRKLLAILFILFSGFAAQATHVLGAEIGYRHITGLEYEIYVNLYGDCSGNSYSNYFNQGTVALVDVRNGGVAHATVICGRYGDYGKEITPVCDRDSNDTRCKSPSGTVPGIAEFRFRANITLPSAGPNWTFAFAGQMQAGGQAGRSSAITNLQVGQGGTGVIYIEAFLNNSLGPNSSPDLTTVPTPFFCVNQTQQYNIGAVDPDADSLNFRLVDGISFNAGNTSTANYLQGFSGSQPLSASSFNYNAQNGQLSFVANQAQTSLVVNRIEEYKNGVLVGSMTREMNFIVLNNCSNLSPTGIVDSNGAGNIKAINEIEICNADSFLSFVILANDPDSGQIDVQLSGVPSGMNYTVVGNNTTSPRIVVDYTLPPNLIAGNNFSFFVTYTDDDCPISSKQQLAYTVKVVNPIATNTTAINESCIPGADGIINISGSSSNSGSLEYAFNGGAFQPNNTFTGLSAGTYPVVIRDSIGCTYSTNVLVDTAIKVYLFSVDKTDITCFSKNDGSISAVSVPNSIAANFLLLPDNISNTSGQFNFLDNGSYTIIASTAFGCADTATIEIVRPPQVEFDNLVITDNRCNLKTGRIEIGSNITIPVEYSISPNQQTNSTGAFGGLIAGQYIITVLDSNGCYKDTLVEVKDDPSQMSLNLEKQDVSCDADGIDGSAFVSASGGIEPYTYFWESIYGTEGTTSSIANQRSGVKRVFVTDAIGCEANDYIEILPANCCEKVFLPTAFTPNGDGKNETFNLRSPLTMTDVKFVIMNRWGQKVWETNNQLDSWDGNYPSGEPADIGTYYYFLRYQCDSDKNNYQLKGDVTIVR